MKHSKTGRLVALVALLASMFASTALAQGVSASLLSDDPPPSPADGAQTLRAYNDAKQAAVAAGQQAAQEPSVLDADSKSVQPSASGGEQADPTIDSAEQDRIPIPPGGPTEGIGERIVEDPWAEDWGCDVCGIDQGASQLWVQADYLLWWTDGMFLPPLVTTGANAAALTLPNARILFGNSDVLDSTRHGGRIRVGGSTSCPGVGYEGEYFGLPEDSIRFRAASDANGLPFLGRPFFNINPLLDDQITPDPPAREDAQLVSGSRTDEVLVGSVTVDAHSSFSGAAARLRWCLCDRCGVFADDCYGDHHYGTRVTLLTGYRYFRLSEGLMIREDLTSTVTNGAAVTVTDIDIFDRFDTLNEFHGGEIGFEWLTNYRTLTLAMTGRIAIGDITQSVNIDGQTTNNGNTGVGGLLAQTSNIGRYQRSVFGVAPELDLRLTRRLTRHISCSVGYTFIYLSRVARPGEQVDLDVNPELLPPPNVPVVGAQRPAFTFRDSDYWAQGLSLGVQLDW